MDVAKGIIPDQWRIQDFPEEGAPTLQGGRQHTILPNFPKNCMKLKEFGPGGARPKFYYVDPPLQTPSFLQYRISTALLSALYCQLRFLRMANFYRIVVYSKIHHHPQHFSRTVSYTRAGCGSNIGNSKQNVPRDGNSKLHVHQQRCCCHQRKSLHTVSEQWTMVCFSSCVWYVHNENNNHTQCLWI